MERENIELEFRTEVESEKFDSFLNLLQKQSSHHSYVKRLSVMFLGKVSDCNFDIRIRIDSNNKAELVVKKGDFHSHNREENSQSVKGKDQFMGLVKIFSLFGFSSKITERENFDFVISDGLKVTAVRAKNICYLEFEKMSSKESLEKNESQVILFMKSMGLSPIDKRSFDDLCSRLGRDSDIVFSASTPDFLKLESLLKQY